MRLLVVEDDDGIALGLEDDLRLEGYDVVVARDGERAVRCATTESFDLVVLDLMLPKKDGYQVLRELRRAGVTTPVIMLTARAQDAEKVLGLELGADDYVTKPFNPMELRARIKAVLRRASGQAASVFRFADIEVDTRRCEVRRAGVVVPLSTIEFKLLTAFIEARGAVLSRERLLDAVWGHDIHVTDRAVDNHVVGLRRKIEADPADPKFITSVRGMGYRFDG
ncbi:DNA-binding response regulator [Luteitalea sp. TBR-22]|uniref:response regulator transcription factor n=1 Tax=Luteitalea sp. TBR-22 TaxID=2802971 RepID=UPI001AF88B15|nr:response regulator transcription factor [Luteitalea sp. TBR-22]BCS35278.1 DNA-binding response regulator [Luteitalea sp. TBR-22]